MPYQKPKSDHPWRQYKNRTGKTASKNKSYKKSVRVFVEEIIGNWENVEIYTTAYGKQEKFFLTDLPERKQAAWLVGLIKKVYGREI